MGWGTEAQSSACDIVSPASPGDRGSQFETHRGYFQNMAPFGCFAMANSLKELGARTNH
jgi:hypothetical protein